MPVPFLGNPFRKVVCKQCGWKEVSYQPGDVILMPTTCPHCEEKISGVSKAGVLESILCDPVHYLKYQLKPMNRR